MIEKVTDCHIRADVFRHEGNTVSAADLNCCDESHVLVEQAEDERILLELAETFN